MARRTWPWWMLRRSARGSTLSARLAAVAVVTLSCSVAAQIPERNAAHAAPKPRLVVISLDGLYPEIYRRSAELGLDLPHLATLVREGTSADGMLGIFPSSTYPSHTTLVTGARSARHGVTANSTFDPLGMGESAWYWYADSVRVRTLPQAAYDAGFTVGVSNWPALVGAPWIHWHLPEIWSVGPSDASSREKTLRWATPGLVAAVERRFGAWTDERFEWGRQDDRITDGAVYLIEAKRPQVLLVHLVEVDHVLHAVGRNAPEALRAFEVADAQIGRMLAALQEVGLRDSTNVVVVGDHGFANVHTEVRPNVLLAERGLLRPGDSDARQAAEHAPDASGAGGRWRARVRTTTAAAALYLRDPADRATAAAARAAFDSLASGRFAGVFAVLDRRELDRYGAFPGAAFGLACLPGYSFSSRENGDVLVASRSRGMHGYRPEEPAMHAGFIAAGPAFPAGRQVPVVRMLDVAPTLAALLGIDLGRDAEGLAVPGLLRRDEERAGTRGGKRTAP